MTSAIEQIGPILGLVALIGLIVLAFLIFGQGRELRRLRDWAGRAPERADEAAEASLAAQEARSDEPEESGGRLAGARAAAGSRFAALDSRLPFDGRILIGALAVLLVAAIVLTGAFGLIGSDSGDSGGGAGGGGDRAPKVQVAVLNATQTTGSDGTTIPAEEGLADAVARGAVNGPDFRSSVRTNAPAGEQQSIVMFDAPGDEADAEQLAEQVSADLGDVDVESMSQEVRDVAEGAPIALLVGLSSNDFGDEGTDTTTDSP